MQIGLLLLLLALMPSCSMINTVAVKTTGSVIHQGSEEILTENNWHHFVQAAPANLKLIEGLWYSDQDNEELLSLLIKGYGAYGFAAYETKALKDILLEKEKSFNRSQTLLFYQRAIFYGEKYLQVKGIEIKDFWNKDFPNKLSKVFDNKMSKDDLVGLFYFAQSLGSSINLQRTNVQMMGKMNHVIKMFDWICKKDPTIEHSGCELFNSIMAASVPSIMGGSQSKARKSFQKLMKNQPANLLAQVSYIQYHIVPMMEEEEFDLVTRQLERKISDWYDLQLGKESKTNQIYKQHRYFNLYNSIAKERLKVLKGLKSDLL